MWTPQARALLTAIERVGELFTAFGAGWSNRQFEPTRLSAVSGTAAWPKLVA